MRRQVVTPARALMVSGHFGMGHDVVAEACAAALTRAGVETRTVDAIALLGSTGGALGDWVFRRLLAVPPLYDAFHFSGLRQGGALARWLDRRALANMWKAFRATVDEFPAGLVVSVFATGAAAAARLKRERPEVRSVVVCTDSYAHRLWVHDETDLFLVTSQLTAESIRRFRPHADVAVLAAPVRPPFYAAPARADARAALGVDPEARCVLLMSGAWGIGPVDEAARSLAESGYDVLAVAGSNRRLEAGLRELARTRPTLHPFGFTDRVPELMAAADIVVTTSGDTCSEARVVGRPILLVDAVPGHGRENLMHELERGHARVVALDPDVVVAGVDAAFDDGAEPYDSGRTLAGWEHDFLAALGLDGPG